MFRPAFEARGLAPVVLSRTLGDSAAVTSPLVPWNSCGAYMAATLGVATTAYRPLRLLQPDQSARLDRLRLPRAADAAAAAAISTPIPNRSAEDGRQTLKRRSHLHVSGHANDQSPHRHRLRSSSAAAHPAAAQQASTADIDRLMAVIEAQQAQIDAMRAELDAMKAAAHRRGQPRAGAPRAASPCAGRRPRRSPREPRDEDDRTEAQMVAEGFTWRDQSGRSLTLSGQVNPAFNVVDDGISTDVFIVDNDTSGTRFRLDADAPARRDLASAPPSRSAPARTTPTTSPSSTRRPTPTSTSAAPR